METAYSGVTYSLSEVSQQNQNTHAYLCRSREWMSAQVEPEVGNNFDPSKLFDSLEFIQPQPSLKEAIGSAASKEGQNTHAYLCWFHQMPTSWLQLEDTLAHFQSSEALS